MSMSKLTISTFMIAAFLFLVVAFVPVMRGGSLDATFLALAVVFFVLGIAAKKRRDASSPPPPH